MKKRLAALTAALLLLTSCGTLEMPDGLIPGETSSAASEPVQQQSLSLPYNLNDSLYPYAAQTEMNLTLTPLIYDPLFKLDEKLQAQPCLAAEITSSGLEYTVTLRSDAVFSDGQPVTARDVVYSYQQTELQSKLYWQLHTSVASAEAVGERQVRFTAYRTDKNLAALLSFPIVKYGDNGTQLLGTGRYTYHEQSSRHWLEPNPHHKLSLPQQLQRIELTVLPDDATVANALRAGVIHALYTDLSQQEDYGIGTKSFPVETGNVVYLGYHGTHPIVGRKEVRELLDTMLPRQAIASDVYYNKAVAAKTPFSPSYYDLPGEFSLPTYTEEQMHMALELQGLKLNSATGKRSYEDKPIVLKLLVNEENGFKMRVAQQVVRGFGMYGITVEVDAVSYRDYQIRLANGEYDLFLAEVKLGYNQDLTPLLSGSSIGIGGDASDASLLEKYYLYCAGQISCAEFLEAFIKYHPVSPLVYRQGGVMVSQSFTGQLEATDQDIFYNLDRWYAPAEGVPDGQPAEASLIHGGTARP